LEGTSIKETTLENKASFIGNDFKKKFSPPIFFPSSLALFEHMKENEK
jgi:hypothetical protein